MAENAEFFSPLQLYKPRHKISVQAGRMNSVTNQILFIKFTCACPVHQTTTKLPSTLLAEHQFSAFGNSCGSRGANLFIMRNVTQTAGRYNITVCFLLGNSPASEFYMPTFRNTLSIFKERWVWRLLHTCPPMKMEQTECSETSAYKIHTPGELPRRKHTAFRTRRKFEIKVQYCSRFGQSHCHHHAARQSKKQISSTTNTTPLPRPTSVTHVKTE